MNLPNEELYIDGRLNKIEQKLDTIINFFTGEDFHRMETKIDMIMDYFNIGKDQPLSPSQRKKYVNNLVAKYEERQCKREGKK